MPRLEQVVLDFDRDGRLSTKGLATCAPASIERLGVAAARQRCGKAIVGKGQVGALVLVEGRWLRVTGELTLFNGPRVSGQATVVAHAQPVSIPERNLRRHDPDPDACAANTATGRRSKSRKSSTGPAC